MKSAQISFHRTFPATPVSGWVGARWHAWVREDDATGYLKLLSIVPHPFPNQRKLWCMLEVHVDEVDLRFAMPQELDHFIDILSQNPLPSGRSLTPNCAIGRPKNHWLTRLPSKAKSLKFRKRIFSYLSECHASAEFRDFYKQDPVITEFPGFYDTREEALASKYDNAGRLNSLG